MRAIVWGVVGPVTSGDAALAGAFSAALPGAGMVVVFTLRTPDDVAALSGSACASDGAAEPAGMIRVWPIWRLSARTLLRARIAASSAPSFWAIAWGVSPGWTL